MAVILSEVGGGAIRGSGRFDVSGNVGEQNEEDHRGFIRAFFALGVLLDRRFQLGLECPMFSVSA